METNFVKADSSNLPKVDYDMIDSFYKNNMDYLSANVRNVKSERGGRQTYGDDAIGYVQLMRQASVCTVKCRITPEHKVREKGYLVTVVIDEEVDSILECRCHSCPASEGGCKHGIALLFWLLRRTVEPSVTSVECYWRKSTLGKVGSSLKATKLTDMYKNIPPVNLSTDFLSKVVNKGLSHRSTGVLMEYFENSTSPIEGVSLFHLANYFIRDTTETTSAENFILYCKEKLTKQLCDEVQNVTKGQSNNKAWFEVRFARITASKLHEAAQCTTMDGSLTETILGATKFLPTKEMKRGLNLEDKVLDVVCRKRQLKVDKAGIYLNRNYPIFGASPDAISSEFCIEIKCPSKTKTFEKYLKDGEITRKPYAQIQLQMFLCGKTKGLYCVASEKFEQDNEVFLLEVPLDSSFCERTMEKATKFWKEAIFPKLINQ